MTSTNKPLPPQRLSLGQPVPGTSHSVPLPSSSATSAASGSSSASALLTPAALALSAPAPRHVEAQALHYLTIEMRHTLARSTRHARRRREKALAHLADVGLEGAKEAMDGQRARGSAATAAQVKRSPMERPDPEGLQESLEAVGYHVGANMAERLSRDRPPFGSSLDVLKFVCKEVWSAIWDKQVDNLRTNHRGVYVLQDNHFKPLQHMSAMDRATTLRMSKPFLAYPAGIVRGALTRLGVPCTVVAEATTLPQCSFHVKTLTAPAPAPGPGTPGARPL